jgi:hypothetical protein
VKVIHHAYDCNPTGVECLSYWFVKTQPPNGFFIQYELQLLAARDVIGMIPSLPDLEAHEIDKIWICIDDLEGKLVLFIGTKHCPGIEDFSWGLSHKGDSTDGRIGKETLLEGSLAARLCLCISVKIVASNPACQNPIIVYTEIPLLHIAELPDHC